jgi:hypothetical protein
LICMSIRLCPPVTKLKAPAFPLRMGTGFSVSGVCAAVQAELSRRMKNSIAIGRAFLCRHRDAIFLHRYSKTNST